MIRFSNVSISYGSKVILSNLFLEVMKSKRMALLGTSGCGKTSVLRTIIEKQRENNRFSTLPIVDYKGSVVVNKDATIGYVPQEPSLAPWIKVRRNIVLGINLMGEHNSALSDSWIQEVISELELEIYLSHFPNQLSMGTSKRVSLARALVLRPSILLLDEPFSGFDFDIRERAIAFIHKYCNKTGTTMILVTHEPYEAACLCDQVSVIVDPINGKVSRINIESDGQDKFRNRILVESRKLLGKIT